MEFFDLVCSKWDCDCKNYQCQKQYCFPHNNQIFSTRLAGKFCQELATLVHLQTSRCNNTLIFPKFPPHILLQCCAGLTVSAIAVHSLASELSYSHRRLGPMVSGTQVDEVKNCNKGEITSIRIFTVSQKESHSVQKLKLVFIYLVLHLILHNTRKIRPHT